MAFSRCLLLLLLGLLMPACARPDPGQVQRQVSVASSDGVTRITVDGHTVELKETERTVAHQVFETGAKPRVVIDLFAGKIAVEAGADGAVEADVTRLAAGETREEAKANLQLIDVQMKQEDGVIRITARRSADADKGGQTLEALKKQYAVRTADTSVKVPAGAVLIVKTAFGDVHVAKVTGSIEAETSSGAVTIAAGKGELKLTSHFGNLTVDGAHTAVVATTKSGAVVVKGANGPLDLSTDFGTITVEGAADKVTARTKSGAVQVKGATALVTLTSGFGALSVDGAGAVQAETKSGAVTVKGATGAISAKSGFGKVVVEQARAGARLETASGDIVLRAAQGTVALTSGFGAIDAEVSGATVKASSKSGAVKVRGVLAEGEHALHSSFGKVTLAVPGDSHFHLDAATKFGTIRTAFALTRTDEKSERRLRGAVGDNPRLAVKLTADSGDIDVLKE